MTHSTNPADRLISRAQLRELVPVSDMSLWRFVKAGTFPAPVKLTKTRTGRNFWRLSDINAWLAKHAVQRAA